MKSSLLKYFRVFFSGIVFLCFCFIFVDIKGVVPEKWVDALLSVQFIPSVVGYLGTKSILAATFLIILILTFLTGRTYCSFLCPLGIGQDIISRFGGRIKKKFRRFGYQRPNTIVRYSVLVFVLIMTILSGVYVVTLLDPYSIFGRCMTFFVKPVIVVLNNFASSILERFDIYALGRIKVAGYPLLVYTVPAVTLLLIGFLAFTRGRFYCNTVCPVGTLFGLVSKISIFRVKLDVSKCRKCGRCAVSCKSSCIDFMKNEIDISRCVNCFNCIRFCPEKAISYGLVGKRQKVEEEMPAQGPDNNGRREFIAGSIALLLGTEVVASGQDKDKGKDKKIVPQIASTVKENRINPICPPGAIAVSEFNKKCTACSLCITSCPTSVLQPSFKEYGLLGMLQPVMNYKKGFCTYNCNVCTDICPTDALNPLTVESKKLTQIGAAQFIKDNCIVKIEKTACGACSESCPTKAVYMVPYEGNLLIPEVDADLCVGCGHCEYACPMTPYKAIFVDGYTRHGVAQKPVSEKAEKAVLDDFPF